MSLLGISGNGLIFFSKQEEGRQKEHWHREEIWGCHTGFGLSLNHLHIRWCKVFLLLLFNVYVCTEVCGKGSPCVHALMNTCLWGPEAFMDTVYILHYPGSHQWGYVAGLWAPGIFLSPALGLKMCAIITNMFTWVLGLWLWSSRLEDKHSTYQMGYLHSPLFSLSLTILWSCQWKQAGEIWIFT